MRLPDTYRSARREAAKIAAKAEHGPGALVRFWRASPLNWSNKKKAMIAERHDV